MVVTSEALLPYNAGLIVAWGPSPISLGQK